ncbi:thiamine diphosphokinase, partial [Mitsuokella multacida]|uniref:thiamine diphosphokinase n=1 Tax=Mitsuokella multacida TaxID=52226 RepID=UPI003FEEE45F
MPKEAGLCTAHAQAKAGCLQLPQLRLQGPLACFQDACLLVVGGRAPEAAWLREAAKGREVCAVDHGLDACLAAGIRPQRLIGDGDSAAPAAWQLAKEQHIPIEQFPVEKDDTDTQLALKLAREAGFPAAIVTGAFGGRFDHALSTVTSCAFAPLPCLLADERE